MSKEPLYPHVPKSQMLPPDEELERQIRRAKTIEDFPLWRGKGYRVHIENWGIPRGTTVAGVIRFEAEELGNERHLSDEQLRMLERYPANNVIWVARNREAATEYLGEGMSRRRDITEFLPSDFGEGARIIDLDYQDGYLVMYGDAIKQEKEAQRKGE